MDKPTYLMTVDSSWIHGIVTSHILYSSRVYIEPHPNSGFAVRIYSGTTWTITAPYWFLVLVSATLTTLFALSWIRLPTRFSLRTLLIVTTLVAVVLGLVVWAVR